MLKNLNATDVHYDDVGSGTPLLLVHGHPLNRSMWAPQAEALAARYRLILPDLRGYGDTPLPANARETSLETFAADNLALMDALGIDTFLLGGLSMGGQIVLEMYRQAPQRIEKLLLADTFAGLDSPEGKQLRLTTADRLEREGMEGYAREVLTRMITPENATQRPDLAAHVLQMMTTTPPAGAAAALRGRARRRDYRPLLGEICVPVLVVVGREDAYTPVALAEELQQNIPQAELVVIDGAGHMPNLERPDAFNDVLEEWLAPAGATTNKKSDVPSN